MKAEPSWLIPGKLTANLELLTVVYQRQKKLNTNTMITYARSIATGQKLTNCSTLHVPCFKQGTAHFAMENPRNSWHCCIGKPE